MNGKICALILLFALLGQTVRSQNQQEDRLNKRAWDLRQQNPDSACFYASQALELAETNDYYKGQAIAHNRLGMLLRNQGAFLPSITHHHEAKIIAEQMQDTLLLAKCYNYLGSVHHRSSNYQAALEYHQKSITLKEGLGDTASLINSLINTSSIFTNLGQEFDAISLLLKAIEFADRGQNDEKLAMAYNNLGAIYAQIQQPVKAIECFNRCKIIYKNLNNRRELARTFENQANIYDSQGKDSLSFALYNKALTLFEELDDPFEVAMIHNNLGTYFEKRNQDDQAQTFQLKAKNIQEEIGDLEGLAFSLICLGQISHRQREHSTAIANLEQGQTIADSLSIPDLQISARQELIAVHYDAGNYTKAKQVTESYASIQEAITADHKKKLEEQQHIRHQADILEWELKQAKQEQAQTQLQNTLYMVSGIALALLSSLLAAYVFKWVRYQRLKLHAADEKNTFLTERNKLLQAMNEMLANERKRIGSDLHDRLGALLTTSQVLLGAFKKSLPAGIDRSRLELAEQTIDDTHENMRIISHNLVEGLLAEKGLIPALEHEVDRLDELATHQITIMVIGLEHRLHESIEQRLFYLTQELIVNAWKHGEAPNIDVIFSVVGDKLTVQVNDNGKGIEDIDQAAKTRIGLSSLSSKLTVINGTYKITPAEPTGTNVTIEIPLKYA